MQLPANSTDIPSCSVCLYPFVTPKDSLYPFVDADILNSIDQLPFESVVYTMLERRECKGGCGDSYCSEECEKIDKERGHDIICTPPSPSSPLSLLREHCQHIDNPLPLVYVKMIAHSLHLSSSLSVPLPLFWKNMYSRFTFPEPPSLPPYHPHKSEDVINGDHNDADESHETPKEGVEKSGREKMIEEQLALISSLFLPLYPHADFLCEKEEYEKMIEMMNVNQQMVSPSSPFDLYWKSLSSDMEADPSIDLLNPIFEQLQAQSLTRLTCSLGSGLYLLHHCLNHSCSPSALVTYILPDGKVSVFAKRRIRAGEEITFNYCGELFEKMGVDDRREILKSNFKFDCECARCLSDRPANKPPPSRQPLSRGGRGKRSRRR